MKKILCLISIVCIVLPLLAENSVMTYTFNSEDFTFSTRDNYNVITPARGKNYILNANIGEPQLPLLLVHLSIPSDKEISEIHVLRSENVLIDGEFLLLPVQKPKALSDNTPIEFIKPLSTIYSSKKLYPEKLTGVVYSGYLSGYHISSFVISPFQYDPSNSSLQFHTELEIEIIYKDIKEYIEFPAFRTFSSQKILEENIVKLVDNFSDLHKPAIPVIDDRPIHLKEEIYEYLIIASPEMTDEFQALAEWKQQKGLYTAILSTTEIYDTYSGNDNAEKIRNCIKDYYQNHGTLWVLLGGDIYRVPYREAFAFNCEYGQFWHNYIPCDLYFSDLDGTWNDNGNDVYGELEDNIDMFPDVFVGRASVENETEAADFVSKILTYEKNPPLDYLDDMLFLASVLWNDPYTDSGQSKNLIDELYVPDQFDPITKLYQSMGNINYDDVMANLNEGKSIVNHCGHAWYSAMSLGNGHLYNSDMDALTNAPAFSIWFTIGCWPAAFDYNCIAEHWINNPDGGGVAFIGNSRYGWGSPGNPTFGYSDIFDQEFFNQLFQQNITNIGAALAMAKSVYVPYARNHNVFRWCEYQLNLLGEPEMPVWTDVPQDFTVSHPSEITPGDTDVFVVVSSNGGQIGQALVCLYENGEILARGYTDQQGEVTLSVVAGSSPEDIIITVSKQDFVPYQCTIETIYDQPYVLIDSYAANNSPDGYILPGVDVVMDAGFRNFGQISSENITVELHSDSDKITFSDSTHFITLLLPKTGIFEDDAFSFHVSSALNNGEIIPLYYTISDDSDGLWEGSVTVIGAKPAFEYIYHQVGDSANGNGNGIPEPGEELTIQLIVKNIGLCQSHQTFLNVSSTSPDISIPYCSWEIGDVYSQHCANVVITIAVNQSCLPPVFPELELTFTDSLGFTNQDSFALTIGETGFSDDMEAGDSKWTHWGNHDLWHLTDNKALSGNYSWYCGFTDSLYYPDNVEDYLQSIPFTIGTDAQIEFWCSYEFTNYGVDGIYVEIYDGTEWYILDFIGSGGALVALTTKNDWLEYQYDISFIPEGVESQVRFRFVSDSEDVAEGAYIDHVYIYENDCPLQVDFVASTFYGQEPLTIDFLNKSSADTGPIVSYAWDFGDGGTSDEMNPSFTYAEDGLKTISLIVSDQFGIERQVTKANYIHVLPDTTKTVYVKPDGTANCTTISEALDVLNPGDSLVIADGMYAGPMNTNLTIPKDNITICSENGFENCIIDGGSSVPAFMIGFHEGIEIKGITFESCHHNGYGGAISTNGSSVIRDCFFLDCSSDYDGGAIWAVGGTSLEIENCIFESCDADKGGALFIELVENVSMRNSYFISCQSNESSGGAVYLNVIYNMNVVSCSFENCTVMSSGEGGGLCGLNVVSMQIRATHFYTCEAASSGGGMFIDDIQETLIDSCTFVGNISNSGGAFRINDSNTDIFHCKIVSNEAIVGAGGYISENSVVWIEDCLFHGNNSNEPNSKGGALYSSNATFVIINSTIANNEMSTQGGGISHLGNYQIGIYNSIFWDNLPVDIWSTDSLKISIRYSDLTSSWSGEGNISTDPLFVNISDQDYHLNEYSPCIDEGRNSYVHSFTDLDGNVRIWSGTDLRDDIVDMGCYEYGAPTYIADPEIHEHISAALIKNFPNPFTQKTQIEFYLPMRQHCTIEIYNIRGQKIKTLIDEEEQAGYHHILWDGRDQRDRAVANGIYFYMLRNGQQKTVKKLVLMRQN